MAVMFAEKLCLSRSLAACCSVAKALLTDVPTMFEWRD